MLIYIINCHLWEHQSLRASITQFVDHSICRSLKASITESVDHWERQSLRASITESVDRSIRCFVNSSIDRLIDWLVDWSIDLSIDGLINSSIEVNCWLFRYLNITPKSRISHRINIFNHPWLTVEHDCNWCCYGLSTFFQRLSSQSFQLS